MLLGNPKCKTQCQSNFFAECRWVRIENTRMMPQTSESLHMNAQPQSHHIQPAFVSEDGLSKTPISRTTLLFPTFEGCTWSSIRTVFLNELSQSLSNLATSLSLGSSASSIWPSMMPWTLFPPWLLPSLSQLSCVFWDTENMSPFWEAVSASPSIWASWL